MINLILFGPPGSGKGTQASKLVERYQLNHISTGDLFRFNLKNNTPLGLEAKKYIEKGELVPDEVTINMLQSKVKELIGDSKGFIFDGFPRNVHQAKSLDAFLTEQGETVTALLSLTVDDDEIVKRILSRGKTSGRADDNDEAIIRNRIAIYKSETSPVFDYYDTQGKSEAINGIGSIDTIFERLTTAIDQQA